MQYQNIQKLKLQSSQLQIQSSLRSQIISNRNLSTLKGLFIKSLILHKRNYCSNICQILTPILCLLFTLAVREIVGGITTGKVKDFQIPQPFNQPLLSGIVKSQIGLTCQQIFYYENEDKINDWVDKILNKQQRSYCDSSQSLNPIFKKKDSVNKGIIQCLNKADNLNFERGDDLNTEIPDGFIKFNQVSDKKLNVTLGINDFRLPQYHKNNGITKIIAKASVTTTISTYLRVTEGMMTMIDKVTRPYLQLHNEKQIINGFYMYMPFSGEDKSFINKMINSLGSGLYPLGLSILLPLFLYVVVSQKQEKQLQIMKMNGLNIKHYWINFFIVSFIISMISSLNMYVFAYLIDIMFFTRTAASIIWLMFITWAIAQISMTTLFQVFINNSKAATIIGYLLSIFSTIIGLTVSTIIFPFPSAVPIYVLMYPPFALSRIVYLIGMACSDERQCYRSIWDIDAQVTECFVILFSWISLYFLSIWLNEMVQQEFGVAHRPLIIQKILRCFKKPKKSQLISQQIQQQKYGAEGIQLNDMQSQRIFSHEQLVDISVNSHSQLARQSNRDNQPLLILDLRKKYQNDNGQIGRVALKQLTLKLNKGQIFGFLGPNGAGKTTLISVLTGMYPQTSGNAWISGNQIGHSNTNKIIGVCPQFDILWHDLTIKQHLIFYSRLKNQQERNILDNVDELLRNVDLYQDKHMTAKELSGGMQRRLSIAIALIGNPSVAFLDQPSSGLDPYHRRQIWNILLKCKGRTTIFLTSHLMDQVQFLCDRIAIINRGQLKCIGTISDLKQKFGQGYTLTISYLKILRQTTQKAQIPQNIKRLIQDFHLTVQNQLQTRIVLRIQKDCIFKCINSLRNDKSIEWSINQPSLYDVFCHFIK